MKSSSTPLGEQGLSHAAAATGKRTHTRYLIVAILFIVSMLNNADRAILSITGTEIQSSLGMDAITLGYLFSSFAWAYMLAQIPGGWLIDRFGSKRVYGFAIFLWSFFTLIQGFVPILGVGSAIVALFVLRIAVGLAEGPTYPNNSRVVSAWFPSSERATASAIFNSAQYAAAVVFTPLMGWLTHAHGWPAAYFVMGVLGIVIALGWMALFHFPTRHPRASQAEIDYIREGGGMVDLDSTPATKAESPVHTWACLKELLGNRMLLGVYVGQFGITTIVYFFLTWFPIYLIKGLNMPIMNAGFIAAIPAVFGFLGGVLGGLVSDWLLKRGHSVTFARKSVIVVGMLLSMSIVLCNWADGSQTLVVLFMTLAFFGKGVGSLGWTVVADTSPKEAAGLAGGLFNTFANAAGITTPIVIGYLVQTTGSFDWALIYVAANAVLAIFAFLFIVGPIKRVELKHSLKGQA
ncbi:MFS transporter, ACS family, glucarate transporter [Pseudomonas flavescens]|uniref:MFS transporter, ACS family, glucarate transporter n=1 Tax=Phytopseudomonas flavescens TaxID=29435 RepID=A0A1G7Y459_9GAMM|nr:MFS transporter [Pseudomonas flavescens]SDG91137.1 MFS transporter, ACS family, glucarate transporter [Pseudomonas flavescens]